MSEVLLLNHCEYSPISDRIVLFTVLLLYSILNISCIISIIFALSSVFITLPTLFTAYNTYTYTSLIIYYIEEQEKITDKEEKSIQIQRSAMFAENCCCEEQKT